MATLGGMPIILSEWLTEPGPPITRYRTWGERLCQPVSWFDVLLRLPSLLRATVVETQMVPARGYYIVGGSLVMHPQRFRELLASGLVAPGNE